MNATLDPVDFKISQPLNDLSRKACKRIPPLWSLKNFVAVNPFVGLTDLNFVEAVGLVHRVGHGDMLMPAEFYGEQIASGRIQERDFQAAIHLAEQTLPPAYVRHLDFKGFEGFKSALLGVKPPTKFAGILTFADFWEAQSHGGWAAFVVEEISKWCSAYYDQGQSSWRMPWRSHGLFAAWKAAAELDANPELMGLKGFRGFVAALSDNHFEVIEQALRELGVPAESQTDFLHRQLMTLPGWSSYVQYLVREQTMAGGEDDSLSQLLAIRLAYDLSLLRQFGAEPANRRGWQRWISSMSSQTEVVSRELLVRYLAQQAFECGYQRELIAGLKGPKSLPDASEQKVLQAVFCIDVRSEVFRRSLEAQSEAIESIGFAGFFGISIEYLKLGQARGGSRCPVLLTPGIKVRESLSGAEAGGESRWLSRANFRQTLTTAWNSFKTSAISCFSFVETAGLWFGVRLLKETLALASPEYSFAGGPASRRSGPRIDPETCCAESHGHDAKTGIELADQIALAAGALKNMGLTSNFAKLVLICGHGSATSNNPYGSALDCGACGGHAGDANARVAAAILNRVAVREGLALHGINIPQETCFIAGLHNTTTDEVILYDTDNLTAKQLGELEKIRNWLAAASKMARRERAPSLGLDGVPEARLSSAIFLRSRDWSQVRPEWGLAGNAAFIAAPRARTKGLNLGGRTFLHNYEASRDPDKSTLELIMVAPMVVASWINLQYYGSTVDNRLFGSGNKVLHNVVGTFGVWQGNGGDLQPGLPLQSLHDGTRWVHEPLRLNVFIEAEPGDIQSVLAKQTGVRELVENGWVILFAMNESGKKLWRYQGKQFVEIIE
jgi:uncharacterized protein YbcC (UPF0753/DUF2309 family)